SQNSFPYPLARNVGSFSADFPVPYSSLSATSKLRSLSMCEKSIIFMGFFAMANLALGFAPHAAAGDDRVRLIFDTDMGNDIDDALALGVIHALESRGECRLLAVTLSKDNDFAAP